MNKLWITLVLILSVLFVPAYGLANTNAETSANSQAANENNPAAGNASVNNIGGVLYINSENEKDGQLSEAIIAALNLNENAAKKTRYYYNYVDLNDDGTAEIFVQLVGPFTGGTGGDTGLVFQRNDQRLELLQMFTLVRNPIIISSEKTNGWHDIIIRISGGGIKAHFVCMKYDGSSYPNPSAAELLENDAAIKGIGIINDDIAQDFRTGKGLYLN